MLHSFHGADGAAHVTLSSRSRSEAAIRSFSAPATGTTNIFWLLLTALYSVLFVLWPLWWPGTLTKQVHHSQHLFDWMIWSRDDELCSILGGVVYTATLLFHFPADEVSWLLCSTRVRFYHQRNSISGRNQPRYFWSILALRCTVAGWADDLIDSVSAVRAPLICSCVFCSWRWQII